MAKVSVIIPLYNGEGYIREAIESVLSQTFQAFELIEVDDGSTDGSKNIVLGMKGPITYLYQENSGVCAARNQGFLNSQGDYIAFLDQDDRWYPEKLQIQVQQLDQNQEIGIVYSGIDVIDERGKVIEYRHLSRQSQPSKKEDGVFSQFPNPHPYPSTVLMRREIFLQSGMFDPAFKRNCHEDTELWFRIVKKRLGQFSFYPQSLVQRRWHPLQGGRDKKTLEENWLLLLEKLAKLYELEPRWVARMLSREGKRLIRKGEIELGRKYLKRSFQNYPFYWKNLGRISRAYLRIG